MVHVQSIVCCEKVYFDFVKWNDVTADVQYITYFVILANEIAIFTKILKSFLSVSSFVYSNNVKHENRKKNQKKKNKKIYCNITNVANQSTFSFHSNSYLHKQWSFIFRRLWHEFNSQTPLVFQNRMKCCLCFIHLAISQLVINTRKSLFSRWNVSAISRSGWWWGEALGLMQKNQNIINKIKFSIFLF